jgi:hypothetical protein
MILSSTIFFALPLTVLADGDHPEEKATSTWGTYVLLTFIVLALLASILHFVQKKQLDQTKALKKPNKEAKEQHQRLSQRAALLRVLQWAAIAGLVVTGLFNVFGSSTKDGSVQMDHIHGIGYSPDGQALWFASHDGLKVYTHEHWSDGPGEKNDYMGFSVMSQGFYSSGHPAPGSKLKNPFGIVRSLDAGQTLEPLAYYGQIDFHLMAAGYSSHTIYVYNPQPQAQLKEQGLYYSQDEGKTWSKSSMAGFSGEVTSLAVHPDQASTIVVGTSSGAYLSSDFGQTFKAIVANKQITGITYSQSGELWVGTYSSNKAGLLHISSDYKDFKELPIPAMAGDAIAYLTVHPQNSKEISLVTYNRQAYTSTDGGATWKQIVKDGKNVQ